MTRITVDAKLRQQLGVASEVVQFVDDDGRLVGVYRPVPQPPYDDKLIPPLSRDEMERRLAAPNRRPLKDVLRDLQKRA